MKQKYIYCISHMHGIRTLLLQQSGSVLHMTYICVLHHLIFWKIIAVNADTCNYLYYYAKPFRTQSGVSEIANVIIFKVTVQ